VSTQPRKILLPGGELQQSVRVLTVIGIGLSKEVR
jgi:hypothetical protein